jgi:hypothetical protein
MNMNMNATVSVDSAQNKELLWATLQESGAFAGLTRDQFQPVQSAFDRSVQQAAAKSGAAVSLSDANKHIIREFVQVLRTFQPNNAATTNAMKKKKVELIYRAEDIQNERVGEFDRQLREKQAEMDSFLTLKKPADVSFVDAEDKPIGDEMTRLIAQELAARERELVQLKPEDIKKAQQWIGTNATTVNPVNPVKKTVSFSPATAATATAAATAAAAAATAATAATAAQEEGEDPEFEETDSIFSKFKKIHTTAITLDEVYNKLVELEQGMIARHAEIMAKCFCKCDTGAV